MKILAVRGRNIASLEGDFEVDLENGILGDAGLFAITGPTGSGKSTILDALCLALFDTTPRAGNASRDVRPRHPNLENADQLTAQDTRNLLRRGTAEGFAEVDFVGRDGVAYRARWEAYRARRRASGRLQGISLSLVVRETEEALGDTRKRETLAAIEDKLGLSFEQFRRSALLAQGDFAAFLRADEGERSSLLERMTGTDIFARVSRAAYQRAKDERITLAKLKDRVGWLEVLTPVARAEAEAAVLQTQAQLLAADTVRVAAEGVVRWIGARVTLTREVEAATVHRTAARAQLEADAPLQTDLAAVEAALPLQPAVEAADREAATVAQLTTQHATQTGTLGDAEVRKTACQGAYGLANARHQLANEARETARPQLEQAARLDDKLTEATATLDQATTRATELQGAVNAANQAWGVLHEAVRTNDARRHEAQSWLEQPEHVPLADLASTQPRWQPDLNKVAEHNLQLSALQQAATAAQTDVKEREAAAAKSEAIAEARAHQHQLATVALEAAVQAASETPLGPARAAREQARDHQAHLRSLALLAKDATATDGDRKVATQEVTKHQRAALSHVALADAAEKQGATLAIRLAEAASTRDRLQREADVSVHRSALVADEPCPLCGAEAHPWADKQAEDTVVERIIAEQAARLLQLADEHRAAAQAVAKGRAEAAASRTAAGSAQARADASGARLLTLVAEWDEQAVRLQPPQPQPPQPRPPQPRTPQPETPQRQTSLLPNPSSDADTIPPSPVGSLALLQAMATKSDSQIVTLDASLALAKANAVALEAATAHQHQTQSAAAEARRLAEGARSQAEGTKQAAATQSGKLKDTLDARTRLIADLDGTFLHAADWRTRVDHDVAAFLSSCIAAAKSWTAHDAARIDAETQLKDQRHALTTAKDTLDRATAEFNAANTNVEKRQQAHKSLGIERLALFGGRAVQQVRTKLDAEHKEAQGALDRSVATRDTAIHAVVAAKAALDQTTQDLQTARANSITRATARDAALQAVGIELATARARLARAGDWLQETRATLQSHREAAREAQIRVGERQRVLDAHLASPPLPIDQLPSAEAADAALATANEAAQANRDAHANNRAAVTQDDDRRQKSKSIQSEIALQQAIVDHWKVFDDLIGSADGKTFRVFAQGLTLEALLGHANRHLHDLSPRYALERVPESDLDLQIVDHDMGEERRATSSLSGGESFLVSLALALGLASLSSRDTAVETLFIDEGFGTLDPATLELALHTLDQLQAAGRQVGLISHVPGLAERIGAQVMVERMGGGRSRVRVVSG
jgi:DNA repair protein SbcC/Rad50